MMNLFKLKNKVFPAWVLSLLIMCGVSTQSLQVIAGEKVYFKTADGAKFWCDRTDLEYHLDPQGKFSNICNLLSEPGVQDGKSEETAHELNIDGKLTLKYILNLLRYGKVSFKNKADAENTLAICEDLGLPLAEEYICKFLNNKKLLGQMPSIGSDIECPDGYISVPGNEVYSTPTVGASFCVMKYDASREGSTAKSRVGGLPWVNINREAAKAACAANGAGYHLITNAEWMTIARDIEATPANWSAGAVGAGQLSRGNSNSNAAAASGADENPYLGTNHSDWTHKRTHTLSNEEVIWDMAGNVWKWVSDNLRTEQGSDWWQEYNDASHFSEGSQNKLLFAPLGSYSSAQNVGTIYMSNGGTAMRGGTWNKDTDAGVFAAHLSSRASDWSDRVGFRCAYTP